MFPFRDNIPSRTVPFVTHILIWTNLIVFAWQASMGERAVEFIQQFGLVPAVVTGQADPGPLGIVLPFFVSMFLHGGWFHVLGNVGSSTCSVTMLRTGWGTDGFCGSTCSPGWWPESPTCC